MSVWTSHARACSGRKAPVNSSTATGSIAATRPCRSATTLSWTSSSGQSSPLGQCLDLAAELRVGLDRLGHLPRDLDPVADDAALGPVEREPGLSRDVIGEGARTVPAAGQLGHGGRLGDDHAGTVGVAAQGRGLQRAGRPPGERRRGRRPAQPPASSRFEIGRPGRGPGHAHGGDDRAGVRGGERAGEGRAVQRQDGRRPVADPRSARAASISARSVALVASTSTTSGTPSSPGNPIMTAHLCSGARSNTADGGCGESVVATARSRSAVGGRVASRRSAGFPRPRVGVRA